METVVEKLIADTIRSTEANVGNMIVTGKARFVNPVYAEIENAENINQIATVNSYGNSDYILLTNGTSLRKISITTFINQIVAAVAEVISANSNSAENVGY